MVTDNIIELRSVKKSFGSKLVLKGIDLTVKRDDSLIIIGLGDSGKSVLLKIMLHILSFEGNLLLNGKSTKTITRFELMNFRNNSGMLFQNNALFDSLSVRDNIAFYLDNHTNIPRSEVSKRVEKSLERVNLAGVGHLKPESLSGGMRKRVGIARAIIHKPKVLFLDEPTAGLDPIISRSISNLINSIKEELGVSVITVTNDISCARKVGNTIAMIYDGLIYKVGSKEEILNGDDPLIQQFINGRREGPIKYNSFFSKKA